MHLSIAYYGANLSKWRGESRRGSLRGTLIRRTWLRTTTKVEKGRWGGKKGGLICFVRCLFSTLSGSRNLSRSEREEASGASRATFGKKTIHEPLGTRSRVKGRHGGNRMPTVPGKIQTEPAHSWGNSNATVHGDKRPRGANNGPVSVYARSGMNTSRRRWYVRSAVRHSSRHGFMNGGPVKSSRWVNSYQLTPIIARPERRAEGKTSRH